MGEAPSNTERPSSDSLQASIQEVEVQGPTHPQAIQLHGPAYHQELEALPSEGPHAMQEQHKLYGHHEHFVQTPSREHLLSGTGEVRGPPLNLQTYQKPFSKELQAYREQDSRKPGIYRNQESQQPQMYREQVSRQFHTSWEQDSQKPGIYRKQDSEHPQIYREQVSRQFRTSWEQDAQYLHRYREQDSQRRTYREQYSQQLHTYWQQDSHHLNAYKEQGLQLPQTVQNRDPQHPRTSLGQVPKVYQIVQSKDLRRPQLETSGAQYPQTGREQDSRHPQMMDVAVTLRVPATMTQLPDTLTIQKSDSPTAPDIRQTPEAMLSGVPQSPKKTWRYPHNSLVNRVRGYQNYLQMDRMRGCHNYRQRDRFRRYQMDRVQDLELDRLKGAQTTWAAWEKPQHTQMSMAQNPQQNQDILVRGSQQYRDMLAWGPQHYQDMLVRGPQQYQDMPVWGSQQQEQREVHDSQQGEKVQVWAPGQCEEVRGPRPDEEVQVSGPKQDEEVQVQVWGLQKDKEVQARGPRQDEEAHLLTLRQDVLTFGSNAPSGAGDSFSAETDISSDEDLEDSWDLMELETPFPSLLGQPAAPATPLQIGRGGAYRRNGLLREDQKPWRPYLCLACGENFTTVSGYSQHVRAHLIDDRYECPRCRRRLSSQKMRTLHVLSEVCIKFEKHVIRVDWWLCLTCDLMRFTSEDSARNHVKTVHHKKMTCPVCEVSFKGQKTKDYVRHVKTAHPEYLRDLNLD